MGDSGFIRKKVVSLTLGEKLQKFRTEHRMSLLEVSKATKIQVKYLEALETGAYISLPADVYVRGFLRSYARYLGCDEEAILRLYERERHIQASLGKGTTVSSEKTRTTWPAFVITSRTLWSMSGAIVILGAFGYLLSEYRSFVSAPRLIITEPASQGMVSQAELTVRGETDQGAHVLINGQPASVGMRGDFSEDILLQPGVNTIIVSASNRFGKERIETLHIEAVFPAEQSVYDDTSMVPQNTHAVQVSVSAPEQSVNVTVIADEVKVLSGKLEIGEHKDIVADREIRISSDNGKATYITVGSGSPQPLSSEEKPVRDILFTPAP